MRLTDESFRQRRPAKSGHLLVTEPLEGGEAEQSVDALRHSFEARGLQVGRIEIEQPPASKDAPGGATHQGTPGSPEGQFGMGPEDEDRLSKESAAERIARTAGGREPREEEAEGRAVPDGYTSPGIV